MTAAQESYPMRYKRRDNMVTPASWPSRRADTSTNPAADTGARHATP